MLRYGATPCRSETEVLVESLEPRRLMAFAPASLNYHVLDLAYKSDGKSYHDTLSLGNPGHFRHFDSSFLDYDGSLFGSYLTQKGTGYAGTYSQIPVDATHMRLKLLGYGEFFNSDTLTMKLRFDSATRGSYSLYSGRAGLQAGTFSITSKPVQGNTVAVLSGGVLTVSGTDLADGISLTVEGNQLVVGHASIAQNRYKLLSDHHWLDQYFRYPLDWVTQTFPASSVQRIKVNVGAGNDWVWVGSMNIPMHVLGGDGDDVLEGGDLNDILDGGAGSNELNGLAGDDSLYGGAGDDYLVGGDGNDKLYGAKGDDWLVGGSGMDSLYGQFGSDYLVDHILDDNAIDLMNGGRGFDGAAQGSKDILVSVETRGFPVDPFS